MATKAKLTLSQLLFRRTSSNNNSSSSNNNNAHNDASRNEQFSGGGDKNGGNVSGTTFGSSGNSFSSVNTSSSSTAAAGNRKMSGGSGGNVSSGGGRQVSYEYAQHADIMKGNPSPKSLPSMDQQTQQQRQHQYHPQTPQQVQVQQQVQQQLHGILKKPNAGSEGGFGGRAHRSSLQRSKSNPNPSNNPLKEVSWSCPTLEKRREVILNYFERIILENKQEHINAKNKNTTKPNIPCEGGNGEPIYEEISDFSSTPSFCEPSSENNKTGSLKPKLGPKKVRMNIPQDNLRNVNTNQGQSPIYDKVLCRSHSMHESSTSSSVTSSGFYDIAPSTATSISSSGSQSLYENFRPSSHYAASSSSSESDYGIMGGGYTTNGNNSNGKNTTSRIAGRSHSFHDNYRNSGNYNIQVTPLTTTAAVDTDQLYAKVCKRKKLKVCNEPPPQIHQRPSSYPKATKADYEELDNQDELRVQVSCGNVVTMIPVMMPCSVAAASSFSTSCLSLSSSSDNNNDDNMMTITTSISSINTRNTNANHNNKNTNGLFHYEAEKIIPDKNFAYMNSKNDQGGGGGDSCPPTSAAARNRNNLSVIHLLAAYDPAKEIEEFIPTPSFTAIIDSTECAPKSISVPVRVGFSTSTNSSSSSSSNNSKENEEYPTSRQPLMVTNCSFGYDNDAFQDDDGEDADADDEDNNNDHPRHKNFLRSSSSNNSTNTKDISSSATSNSSTSGADDGDDGSCTSDTDTDEDEHHAQKYSFTNNGNGRGILKNNHHNQHHHHLHRVKSITFQEDIPSNNTTAAKDFLLTTSESEDDEELCEHKSLIEMTTTGSILDDSSSGKGDKYGMNLMDDEDRGFDSFLDDSENGNGENSPFRSENMTNQRTFAQMTQDVPPDQLKKKAASVLDLINSEISDLHMRELELKKLHSPSPQMNKTGGGGKNKDDGSAEDEFEEGSSGEDDFSDSAIEYDGFTTNGSHSSGQVSPSENLNEMISQEELQEQKQVETTSNVKRSLNNAEEEEEEEREEEDNKRSDKVDMGLRSEVKVRPLEDDEDRSIKFLVSDETPIEREIRLTREREEEFRRNNHNYMAICPPAPSSTSQKTTASLPIMKTRDVSSHPESQVKSGEGTSFPMDKSSAAAKDKQLEMATARFKKEIEESMQREKELLREARRNKDENEEEINEVTPEAPKEQEENENVVQTPVTPTTPQQATSTTTPPQQAGAENQSQLRKPTIAKLAIAKLPAARFFSPPAFNANKPSRITPVVSPIISKGSLGFPTSASNNNAPVVGGSLPIGINRPSFNNFEKYILQTSLNYMANKQNSNNTAAAATPTTPSSTSTEEPVKATPAVDPGVVNKNLQFQSIPEDPLRIIQKPSEKDESNEGDEEDEEEKPKRRYIPAQDKIHKEIEELAMREKELNHTRAKWKSTLDLPEALKEAEEEKEVLRRTTSTTQSSLSLNTATTNISIIETNGDAAGADGHADDTSSTGDGEFDKLNFTTVTSEDVRQVTRVKAPARRRHSLLINQWEERIRQQQQQNSKK